MQTVLIQIRPDTLMVANSSDLDQDRHSDDIYVRIVKQQKKSADKKKNEKLPSMKKC